jgi:hypothetical protein
MTRIARIAAALFVFGSIAGAARTAAAATLDPFRAGGARVGKDRGAALDPFRVAQALPAVPPEPEPPKAKPAPAPAATPASTPTSAPARAPAPAPASAAAKSCQRDEDCGEGNICQANACQPIELSTNLFPIYYREGKFKEVFFFYWAREGNPGYTVLFPLYWHFWTPTSDSFVAFPVYWHFQDSQRNSALTVIPPFSWSHEGDARSFAFWPLFYKSNRFGWAIPFLLTFNVGDSKIGNQYGAFLGLYWGKRSQKGAFDFGFLPPYVSSRNADHALTWIAPLTFYWRNGSDRNLLAIPLFYKNEHRTGNSVYTWLGYSRREGSEMSASVLWLYWFGRDKAQQSRYDIVFPLLWSFRDPKSSSTVLFPLIWSFSGPKSNTTVAGPFIHYRKDSTTYNVLFPFWWSGGDDATGRGFTAFIPVFVWKRDDKARTATLLTVAGGYSRDDTNGTRGGLIWPLLTFWHSDPSSSTKVITPLYVSHWSKTDHAMTRWVSLLFYQRQDPTGSTTMVFPFLWRFHDNATGATATVTPLGGYRSGPRDDTAVVLLFFWRGYKPSGWSAGLFPLLFFGNNAGKRHAVLFPLFWHVATDAESTTVAAPLFYRHRDRDGYAFGSLIPLLFMGNDRGESYAIQFPLLWHFASERRGTSTTVVPPGYYHTDPDGWSLGLVPFLWARSGKTRSHFALAPLFWHFADRSANRKTTVVLNYLHRTWGDETTDALFPLFHYRRGTRPGGSDETSFTLFPFVHYRRDASTKVLVTPLGATARGPERSGGFLGPYIWYDDKELSLRFIPFLHTDVTNRETGERSRQYGLWFQVDAPTHKARVLFPLWGRYQDTDETGTWVFPTFYRMRRNNGDYVDAFLPLYWRSSIGDRKATVIGPYYDRTGPGVHNYGVVPLFFRAVNPERTITVIPPVLSFRRDERGGENVYQWTAALYFHKHDKDTSLTTVFPLFWAYKRGARETAVGFPLYWHVADANENRSWTYFAPLVFWSQSGTWRTRGLLTGWYTRDAASGFGSQALLPLFYQASGPDHFALFTIPFGYRRSGLSRLWWATPLVWSVDSVQTSFTMAFPFWFRHTNKGAEKTTTVIPPLLYGSRTTPESSFRTMLALFWRYRDIASASTIVLPLFYDVHDYQLSRTTALFPFFVRHQRHSDQNTYWVSPFFYSHTAPGYETTFGLPLAFVPLYWNIKRGNDETTLLLPLYAKWRRPGYRSTLVIPSYYYQEGLRDDGTTDGTYRRIVGFVLPLYDSAVKRQGDFMWNLLGGLVGHENIGQHKYLRLFWFFNFETGAAPRAQTAWYSQPVRTPRKMAPRGLNVAGF